MEKNYNHSEYEENIYRAWENSGAFSPLSGSEAIKNKKKTFSIIMPPPNANDPLHVGHAMFVTIEDILARYHRMKGELVLWQPGTDHAGIETQFVFEKKLAKEGKSRFDYDRATLYEMIWNYVKENSNVAIDQMKKLGASADWDRYKFTLDPVIVDQVLDTFIKLNNDGLVYRSERLVNYCTKCGTAYSELEVNHEEQNDKLYLINYGPVTVATTRPETMLGDVAVAVNPGDERYKSLIGKKISLPLSDREIPIVADEMVDMAFGTGAVKITPTHDANDWAVAERQGWNLSDIAKKHTIIGTNGKMTKSAGKYEGLNINDAREKVLEDLGNLLVEEKPYTHSVGHCYRCNRVIELLPMAQFFLKVKPLTERALNALNTKETKILGAGREKVLRHWLENLRDWNISRQIVWGIQLPVWYKNGDKSDYVVSKNKPGDEYVQESDTFDTWFSSSQWPVVTLKSGKEGDFEAYYPTDVMETAYDILPFWVMRMMMLCSYTTGKSPFKYVYLHGLVRDEKGQKMSKSKGNVINPLELTAKYGTDSLRMALVMSTVPGQDSNTGENKVRGMRNFANKIWNAGRYVVELPVEDTEKPGDAEFYKYLDNVVSTITKQLDSLMIGLASETVYNEFWHWYCDLMIEKHKKGEVSGVALKKGLVTFLKMLHPFIPFVTEVVWSKLDKKELLISSSWPS